MGTLAELKTRIATEMVRDDLTTDLATQLALCIARAIEFHADRPFWFNRATATRSNSVANLTLPDQMRSVESVSIGCLALRKVDVGTIYTDGGTTGRPSAWAENGSSIRFSPAPDATYSFNLFGVAQFGVPATDGASNVWTTEAQDLVAARTRFLLYRDVFRDGEGANMAAQAEAEALDKLLYTSRSRAVTAPKTDLGGLVGWR